MNNCIFEREDSWDLYAYIEDQNTNVYVNFKTLAAALVYVGVKGLDRIEVIFSNKTRMEVYL